MKDGLISLIGDRINHLSRNPHVKLFVKTAKINELRRVASLIRSYNATTPPQRREITVDVNTRITWIKNRADISPQAEELIRFQMQDMAIKVVTDLTTMP